MMFAAALALVASYPVQSVVLQDRPIIGIVSQPLSGADAVRHDLDPSLPFEPDTGRKYIAASYIKFIESAGARAVPIHYDSDTATVRDLVGSVNGVLFPGGSASLQNSSQYYRTGKVIYDAALAANKAGTYFPLWGTCLGFEEMARLLSGDNDEILVRGFDSENYPVPLKIVSPSSRMFGGAPKELLLALTSENITMNNHHSGVKPATFEKILGGTVQMISTNVDRAGVAFVSTFEAKAYPFYGSQWHPEKNGFEWTAKEAIPHSATAVRAMQVCSLAFIVRMAGCS